MMNPATQGPVEDLHWNLISLAPEYIETEHGGYVSALEVALETDQIRNIALSGSYGVGKSSILRELGKRLGNRVVELSLSTLAPVEISKLDESVPIQATTPTNRIQQEIVKQLLYREEPSNTPASRFRRIERFQRGREILTAVLLGLLLAAIFLLTGWTVQIEATFALLNDLGVWLHLIIWGLAAVIVFIVRWLLYGKLRIKQFSAGAATITLDDNSVSYFDQYLDEIVYFFEVSKRDIVIFEDIDRFNDSYIFETLRALNTLLNASPQIEKPIRFIYAIKDSIFDRIGLEDEGRKLETDIIEVEDPAQAEVMRANRTKFFDLVIPVVPFITHRSARNHATKLLKQIEHTIVPELVDLAVKYVPDMRLLKNIRNEFVVFRDRIFAGDGEYLDLSETDLFAMMLYKSTHLTDFEQLRFGKSRLDTLYELSRALVAENIIRIDSERRALQQRLTQIDGVETRSVHLGERLLEHVNRVAIAAGYQNQNGMGSFEFNGESISDLKSAQFWKSIITAPDDAKLIWRNDGYYRETLSFTRSHIETELGEVLDADSWNAADRTLLNEQINKAAEDLKYLRGADFEDLIEHPEFLVNYEGTYQSFASVAEQLLRSGLAYQLMRAGYINHNFTLYTSTFYGDRVSPTATNFIIHHVERDQMDEYFRLEAEDADAVVRECGTSTLKEPALYNVAILDYLLEKDVDAADIMIRSLNTLGERQKQFLQAYLTVGEKTSQFIQRFTELSPNVLFYLVNQAEIDDSLLLTLVNTALTNLSMTVQNMDRSLAGYLQTHYTEFSVLTKEGTSAQVEKIGELFAKGNIVVPSLMPLSATARSSFVSHSLYDITFDNLTIAIGGEESVALDIIRATNKMVYNYVLKHLDIYLKVVDVFSATVDNCEEFISVLEELLKQQTPYLADVIKNASPQCRVIDLGAISKSIWPELALHQRFPATFNNIYRYVVEHGIDARLAPLLAEAGKITEVEAADEDQKVILANTILEAREQLSAAKLRANLVASLDLEYYLNIRKINVEKGELFALLLKQNIIEDNFESYQCLVETDWSTRKLYIRNSTKFISYMTPELLQDDLPEILSDEEIDDAIKRKIVEQSEVYVAEADLRGLSELARLAVQYEVIVLPEVIAMMAKKGILSQHIVDLLEPHLNVLESEDLFRIMNDLGDDYPKLTARGRSAVRVSDTPADCALLESLKTRGIVSSYRKNNSYINVYRKHK
ncbi:YobI family P-loop NTPase [Arcanobacterium haemolyticum]